MPRAVPRLTIALTLAVVALGPAARAQDTFVRTPYSVPDSQEVLHLCFEIERAVAARNFDTAALKLQNLLDYHANQVVLVGPEIDQRFVGSRNWANAFIRKLPEAGRTAYRQASGTAAREMLGRATRGRDEALLMSVVRRYYESGVGPDALRALANLQLVEARFADAAFHLRQLVADFPEQRTDTDLAGLLFALARGGDHRGFEQAIAARPGILEAADPVNVGGETVELGAFARGLRERLRGVPERPEVEEGSWPMYGGSPAREAPAHSVGEIGSVVWKRNTGWRLKDDDYSAQARGYYGNFLNPTLLPSFFPIHPVVSGGSIFFQNGGTVFSLNLLTGKDNWFWNGPLVQGIDGRTNPGTVHTVAVDDRLVIANLEIPVPGTLSRSARQFQRSIVIFPVPQRRLVALDRLTGELVWSHANDMIEGTEDEALLTDVNVGSAPLLLGDTVYAAASVLDNRYTCYLYAFEKETGKVRWRTRLCTGQQELNLFGRVLKELAPAAVSERDGVLYVVTNLGVAAAVDRRSGEILWIRGYPQVPIPLAMDWRTSEERETTWSNSPPIVTEDTLYFTPTDSWDLVALDRRDGALRFLYPDGEDGWTRPEPRYLIGVNEKHVYLAGRQVSAVDRHSGKLVWRESQGAFLKDQEKREEARGRGLVTPDAILTMTAAGLYAFHPDTGERLRFVPMEPLSSALRSRSGEVVSGGNLVSAGGVLLVAGREQIGGWYETEKIHAHLKQRAAEDPGNPRLALELGDIYATWEKYGDAVREYERALANLDGVPPAERERLELHAKKGLFSIHMGEGSRAWRAAAKAGDDGTRRDLRNRAAERYRQALEAAVDDEGRLDAMLALAAYHLASGQPTELQALYERMGRELPGVRHRFPSFGEIPAGLYARVNLADLSRETGRAGRAIEHLQAILADYPHEELFRNTNAAAYARREIDRLISIEGREVYEPFEQQAAGRRDEAAASGDTDALLGLLELYPNSVAAQEATVTAARLLVAKEQHREAAIALRRFLADFPNTASAPAALALLAASLEERGYLESARSALARLKRRYADATIEVDGREVAAGAWADGKLAKEPYLSLGTEEKKVQLPLSLLWVENEGATSYVRLLEPAGIAPPGTEGNVLIGTNGLVRCVDAVNHRPLWKKRMNGIVTRPVYVEGNLVLVNSSGITAIEPDTGQPRWQVPNDASVRAVGTGSGLLFVLTADFHRPRDLTLRCLSPRNGSVVWSRAIPDHSVYDVLFIADEAVGIASLEPAGVSVFDLGTGRLRYRVAMKKNSLGRVPTILDGDKLLIVHAAQRVDLHDLTTGAILWRHELDEKRRFKSGVAAPGTVVYADSKDRLVALDTTTGKVRWEVPAAEGMSIVSTGDAADADLVYTILRRDEDNTHFAIGRSLRTGTEVWKRELVRSRNADFATEVTDRYLALHLNSFDHSQSAWTSRTLFIDKSTGETAQELTVDALQGFYTTANLGHGLLSLSARGRVAVFGPK